MFSTPTDPDHPKVSELIVQLAEVEDAMRHSGSSTGEPEEALAEREQAIIAALRQHGLPFHAHSSAERS